MSKTKIKPVSRKSDLVIQELEKETLIYDLIVDKAFTLNETSSLIWNLCDGENSVSEIAAKLSRQFNSTVNEDVIWLALDDLKRYDLIEQEHFPFMKVETTRREMIRRVGIASLIALPIVSSLAAPTAAHAQSTTCSTAAPGGVQCRCDCATVATGSTCGTGLAVDSCNAGCTCTRTAASCYAGANPALIGTALGACS